ncbi:MAG: hypothetical protein SGBAC_006686 [Bacillariaceae sp.]
MATNFESSTVFMSKDDMIDSFDDSDFNLDQTDLESLLSDLPQLVSDDECDVKFELTPAECDIECDPIPLYEITPGHGNQALLEFASSLEFVFPDDSDTPIQDINSVQDSTRKQKMSARQAKKTTSRRAKQKPTARSAKKTATKREMAPKYASAVANLCPKRDVVCGRGGHATNNPGNRFLLEAVKANSSQYKSLGRDKEGKEGKQSIVQLISTMIQARGGRFLLRQHNDGSWEEASDKKVHEKISHMLRDQPLLTTSSTPLRCYS